MNERASFSGLNPNFNLSESIDEVSLENDLSPEVDNLAVAAAHRIAGELHEDPKSGLANERAWKVHLQEIAENLHEGDELAVTIFDANGFKRINDELGHAAGDKLIGIIGTVFAQTYRRETDYAGHGSRDSRQSQSLARLGGDEFAVFTVRRAGSNQKQRFHTALEDAMVQSHRVNDNLQGALKGTEFEKFKPGLSAGSVLHHKGETVEQTIIRADLQMMGNKYEDRTLRVSNEDREWLTEAVERMDRLGMRVDDWARAVVKEARS